MTQLQELTNKIHTLVPETMELRFGCKVRQSKTEVEGFLVGTPENKNGFGYWFNSENTIYPILEEHITILGHDITLEDVLRAIQKSPKSSKIVVDDYGVFWNIATLENSTTSVDTKFHWEMGEPLHFQSEETIEWLNSIIKVV